MNIKEVEEKWEEKYFECLSMEFSTPSYFSVHHLTVLTYMLQNDHYSEDTFWAAVDLLDQFLCTNKDPRVLMNESKLKMGDQQIRSQAPKNIFRFNWNLTIMGVRTNSAELYCSDVRAWASDVLCIIKQNQENK
jgi:hypothetical protein